MSAYNVIFLDCFANKAYADGFFDAGELFFPYYFPHNACSVPAYKTYPIVEALPRTVPQHRSNPRRNMLTSGFKGMLLQALKASQEEKDRPSEKAIGNAKRAIGKKLRLNEY